MFFLKRKSIIVILLVSIMSLSGLSFGETEVNFIYYEDLSQVSKAVEDFKSISSAKKN